ncbi:ankyrin [Peniophora sp. CONT]|nr:ankyrin [Peniophora sp. CONT]
MPAGSHRQYAAPRSVTTRSLRRDDESFKEGNRTKVKLHSCLFPPETLTADFDLCSLSTASASASEADGGERPDSRLSEESPEQAHYEGPLVNIPWSLQKRLYEESAQSATRGIDSKVFLAYCYILTSTNHEGLRDDALSLVRDSARIDPFRLAPGVKLTPFRAMMELQDWEGLSEVLAASLDTSPDPDMAEKCRQHIYSFGWQRFLVFACAAGADPSQIGSSLDSLRLSSEDVVVNSVRLLTDAKVAEVGKATWGGDKLGALHMAAVSGKPRAVSALLAAGADTSTRDRDSRTALHLCCQAARLSDELSVEVAKAFWEHQPSSVNDIMERTSYTPLRFAVEAEKPGLCQALLQNGADANARAAEGSTALQECAWIADEKGNGRRGNGSKDEMKAVALAKILLTYGKVDVDLRSCHNSVTALGIAATHGDSLPMVSLLLDHGASPQTSVDDLTALGAAVQHSNHEMLAVLLRNGADPNYSVRGVTPLGLAVGLDQHATAPLLLEHGARVDAHHQNLPLVCWAIHIHARQNAWRDEICPNLTLLLRHKAPVDAIARPKGEVAGWSAVHFAAQSLSTATLTLILDHEKSPGLASRTDQDETALHVAIMYSSAQQDEEDRVVAMLKELIRRGVNLDATTTLGETALHLASKFHLTAIRGCLLEAGCNPDIRHPSGRTAQELFELDEETLRHEEQVMRRERRRKEAEGSAKPDRKVQSDPSDVATSRTSDTLADVHDGAPATETKGVIPIQGDVNPPIRDDTERDTTSNSVTVPRWSIACMVCTALVVGIAVCMRASYFHR